MGYGMSLTYDLSPITYCPWRRYALCEVKVGLQLSVRYVKRNISIGLQQYTWFWVMIL